jgi:hypothetical protein
VGLARGGVTDQGPVASVVLIADHNVKTCEHGQEKSLELQKGGALVGLPFGGTERGPLELGREGEGLWHSRRLHGDAFRRWASKRKKKEVGTSCANFELEEGFNAGGRRSGLRWTPVDARDRAGPATLDSHGGDATRRLGVAGP